MSRMRTLPEGFTYKIVKGWDLTASSAGHFSDGIRANIKLLNGTLRYAECFSLSEPRACSSFSARVVEICKDSSPDLNLDAVDIELALLQFMNKIDVYLNHKTEDRSDKKRNVGKKENPEPLEFDNDELESEEWDTIDSDNILSLFEIDIDKKRNVGKKENPEPLEFDNDELESEARVIINSNNILTRL